MPLTKSAKKALRVDRANRLINDQTRNKVKSALKAARLAIAAGDKDVPMPPDGHRGDTGSRPASVGTKIDAAYRELDLAAKKNVIHKNKASRLKSRLAKKLAKSEIATVVEKKQPKAEKTKKETPAKKLITK